MFRNAPDITIFPCPNKGQEVSGLHFQSFFLEHGDCRSINQRLGINEDAIHIENDRAYFWMLIHGFQQGSREEVPMRYISKLV